MRYVDLTSQFKVFAQDLSKKAYKKYEAKTGISFPTTGFFRLNMKSLNRIFKVLFQINDYTETYIQGFFKDFGGIIGDYMGQALKLFEKNWTKSISTFNLFKLKFSLTTTNDINPQAMNLNSEGKEKLSIFVKKIMEEIYNSIREDEDLWSKYFDTESQKIST